MDILNIDFDDDFISCEELAKQKNEVDKEEKDEFYEFIPLVEKTYPFSVNTRVNINTQSTEKVIVIYK